MMQVWSNIALPLPCTGWLPGHRPATRYPTFSTRRMTPSTPLPGAVGAGDKPLYRPISWGDFDRPEPTVTSPTTATRSRSPTTERPTPAERARRPTVKDQPTGQEG